MKLQLAAVALLLCFSACTCKRAPPSEKCTRLVDAILKCDPSAKAASRGTLESSCDARLPCADLDVSTAEGCRRFMGCLYDG